MGRKNNVGFEIGYIKVWCCIGAVLDGCSLGKGGCVGRIIRKLRICDQTAVIFVMRIVCDDSIALS